MFFEVPRRSANSRGQSPSAIHDPNVKKRKLDTHLDSAISLPSRTSKACDRCRVKKTRCLPDGESCKKCRQEGAICTFAQESKPDTKARNSPAYVQMLEGERRILMQALRELSNAKGDISVLDPTLRNAIARMQIGGSLDSFHTHQIVHETYSPEPECETHLQQQKHRSLSSSDQSRDTSTSDIQLSTKHTGVQAQPEVPEQPTPQFSLIEGTLATFPDWDFDDYPLDEYFGVPEDFSYTGVFR